MVYEFTYKKGGTLYSDTVCCCPEEFEEIQRDLMWNGYTDIEVVSMTTDD